MAPQPVVIEINKAALARELKKTISPAKVIPQSSVTVIDEIGMIQKMKGNDKTSQPAKSPRAVILMLSLTFTLRHQLMMEKEPRGADTGIQFRNIASDHNIQHWPQLLCRSSNKTCLIKLLVEELKGPKQTNSRTALLQRAMAGEHTAKIIT